MFDKVELRVPQTAFLRPEFRLSNSGLQFGDKIVPTRPSRHYTGVADLRPFGIDALVHLNYRYGHRHDHKLELLAAGAKTLRGMAALIATVFDVDPFELGLMRVDLAADMRGIAVPHLHRVLRVRFKRTTDEHGVIDYETVGSRAIQYLRFGKSPNCIRVYDKPAECKARFSALLRGVSPDADPLDFEQTFGFPPDAVMTRIERQAGGGRIPAPVSRFGLLDRAADFNPFTAIEIVPDEFIFPDTKRIGVARAVRLIGTHQLVEQFGLQAARAMLNIDGNANRYLQDYREYVRDCESQQISEEAIFESFRASALRQIKEETNTLKVARVV